MIKFIEKKSNIFNFIQKNVQHRSCDTNKLNTILKHQALDIFRATSVVRHNLLMKTNKKWFINLAFVGPTLN